MQEQDSITAPEVERHRHPLGKKSGKLTPEQGATLLQDYISGMSPRAVARKYGVSREAVKSRVRRAGVNIRPRVLTPVLPTRICHTCKEEKPIDQYKRVVKYKDTTKTYYVRDCRECKAKTASANHRRRYKQGGKTYIKLRNLQRDYGITMDDFNEMLVAQKGVCAICHRPETKKLPKNMPGVNDGVQPLSVDHCHESGKVRGLLCHKCNLGLGGFQENLTTLHNAIQYLKLHETYVS